MIAPKSKNTSNFSWLQTYFLFVAFRIINGFFVHTFGHPDEFWQASEVAHKHIFGYGYLSWEWTYKEPIRSPLTFTLFSVFYYVLKIFGLDTPWLVAHGPRVFHSLISGLFDLFYVKIAIYMTDIKDIWFWTIINYTMWYSLYSIPRTIVNVVESVLFIISFYLWKLAFDKNKLKYEIISRALITLAFCMRPTSIVIWAPIWLIYGFSNFSIERFIKFCFKCLLNCIAMVGLCIAIDSIYNKKLTWTAFNFFKINVLENISAQYGIYNPSWYFTAAMPMIMMGWYFPMIVGAISYTKTELQNRRVPELMIIPLFECLFLSMNQHKEDRFIMKLIPFMLIFAGIGLKNAYGALKNLKKLRSILLVFFLFTNLAYFGYSGLIDKRGAMDVMDYLRGQQADLKSIVLFTECHRTPFYAFLHKNITMKFPECSPYEVNPISDSKLLFVNPSYFMQTWLEKYDPSHIVVYNQFLRDEKVINVLKEHNFAEEKRFFNSLIVDTPAGYSLWHELVVLKKKIDS